MRKKKGSRGAVSVFLAIILVPCIVVASLFVDLSRVHLSKAAAESSADLALNALLTNYDGDLKDWYGMVASCQNIEQFYQVSASYFIRALKSQGMSDDEIILLSDYYSNATNDDTIYDLLAVECQTQPEGMIQEVQGANLSNAAMLKEQIVEFMKYRAPIEITVNLVERFKSDPTTSGAIEAEENEPLVQDKQEFYASEGELIEAAYYTYLAIKAYYTDANAKGLTNESMKDVYSKFGEYQAVYKEILGYVISNLSNTSGLQKYNRYTISLTYYNDLYSNPTKNFSEVYSEKKKEDGVDKFYIDLEDVKKLVDDLTAKKDAFLTAKGNFENAAQPVLNKLPYGTGANQTNPVQWWVQMNNAVNASTGTNHTAQVRSAAQEMLRAYSRVLAIDSCELRGTVPAGWSSLDDWKEEYGASSLITMVESLQANYLTAGKKSDTDTYLKAVSNLESVSSSQYGNINAANLYVTVDGQRMNLNSALSHISTQLSATRTQMETYVNQLNKAIDGDGEDTPSLDQLKEYVRAYETNLENWTNTANDSTTDMGNEDRKEISTEVKTLEISEDDVTILKTRLVNIRSQLKDLIADIDALQFGGAGLITITGISVFQSKAGVSLPASADTNGELQNYRDSLFTQKFSPQTLPNLKHESDSAYNPLINPANGEVNTPELWKYLYAKYINKEKEVEDAKSEKDAAEERGKTVEDEAKSKGRYYGGGKDVPWEFSDGTTYDLSASIGGIIGVVEDLITLDFTGMRDDLYATTYIMEMFSYATFENQGKYTLYKEKNPDKVTALTLGNFEDEYGTVQGTDASEEKTWLSSDPKDSYNKSLTNHLINNTNNAAYCAEIEYILCGSNGSTNEGNVKSVYGKIYAIRYGLNLVSGFDNFWNNPSDPTAAMLQTAALFVQGATGGIIPAALVKAILIPIITIFETSKDLDRLEAGFPVEIYKSKPSQWWVSLTLQDGTGTTQELHGIGEFVNKIGLLDNVRHNTGEGIFYSDYLTLFVYLGLNSNAQAGIYQRMAEVIQFNIGTLAENDTYSLTKSRLYFKLDAELRVSPLMIALPFFSYDEYQNELDTKSDWCTYNISTVRGY